MPSSAAVMAVEVCAAAGASSSSVPSSSDAGASSSSVPSSSDAGVSSGALSANALTDQALLSSLQDADDKTLQEILQRGQVL